MSDFDTIGSLLAPALEPYNYGHALTVHRVSAAYGEVVGPMIAKLTYSIHFDTTRRILHLRLASPALRQEMSYKLTDLASAINQKLPEAIVEKITLG